MKMKYAYSKKLDDSLLWSDNFENDKFWFTILVGTKTGKKVAQGKLNLFVHIPKYLCTNLKSTLRWVQHSVTSIIDKILM